MNFSRRADRASALARPFSFSAVQTSSYVARKILAWSFLQAVKISAEFLAKRWLNFGVNFPERAHQVRSSAELLDARFLALRRLCLVSLCGVLCWSACRLNEG
jgi:hypothetical protein